MGLKQLSDLMVENKKSSRYEEILSEIRQLIKNSLSTSDSKTSEDFIKEFIRDDEKTQIEGLINDADVYSFYLEYKNDIDEILSEKEFYQESPNDLGCFGLYDYVVIGTKRAVRELITMV